MVVDVKELEGLLLEDEEDCVDEFPVLEVVVDHVKRLEALRMRGERDGQLDVRSYRSVAPPPGEEEEPQYMQVPTTARSDP